MQTCMYLSDPAHAFHNLQKRTEKRLEEKLLLVENYQPAKHEVRIQKHKVCFIKSINPLIYYIVP